ncbi:DNA adenine methylase [Helicobacter sp. faydin-H20]|uniref:DNA adenine methylase n=1 Tax=Helicobacter anatolicus TaxID=2905874 RepID=UPI001E49C830|nr:DNA adenine methylase [Helicobacter anatolicus]MCE3037485.1 DNA adenine methylase [Helicobacter anatolicus]
MQPTKIKPPFAWVGAKTKIAKKIVEKMPDHKSYIEVFAGGLSVLYAKPKISKVPEIINDLNKELVNLHRVIQTHPCTFGQRLEKMFCSRQIFSEIVAGKIKPKDDVDKAVFYYYLIINSFAGRGVSFAMPKSRPPKKIYKDFGVWSKRLSGVCIENLSFEKILKEYDREGALFYLDPPYYKTEHYYNNVLKFGEKEHRLLAEILKSIKGKFMLSYNDDPFIKELYRDFNIEKIETEYTLNIKHRKKVTELLIKNF